MVRVNWPSPHVSGVSGEALVPAAKRRFTANVYRGRNVELCDVLP